jgi:uncharacterized UPF0160 family protein
MENDEINLLKQHNQELKEAYNTILESCKKEQTENEKLKKELKVAKEAYEVCLANKDHRLREFQNAALQSQNAAKSINQQAEEYEEQIIKLKKELCDWQDAYKELENAHDKIQGVYQDDHCDLLKLKEAIDKIRGKCEQTRNCRSVYELRAETIFEILEIIKSVEDI